MDSFAAFELIKGKFYRRDEVEEFRRELLKKTVQLERQVEADNRLLEQIKEVLADNKIECDGLHNLPIVLQERLRAAQKYTDAVKEMEAYKEKENLIQKSILQAQALAEEIIARAEEEKDRILNECETKEAEVAGRIRILLDETMDEQFQAIKKLNEEIGHYKNDIQEFFSIRLQRLEKDEDLAKVLGLGEELAVKVENIRVSLDKAVPIESLLVEEAAAAEEDLNPGENSDESKEFSSASEREDREATLQELIDAVIGENKNI